MPTRSKPASATAISSDEFIERCAAEAIPVTQGTLHRDLYGHLQQLDADNKNGIWARIIKNAFAPLFIGAVDYVAGNPPWVNWEHLPEGYRDGMKPLWDRYGLFTLSGSAARLGGGKKDISMLFTYAAVDNYLPEGGRLGFVITQSVFKTQGAGDGFRRLRYRQNDTETTWLKPRMVHDLSAMQVFEGATNRTAVFVCEKTPRPFPYPVPYTMWAGAGRMGQNASLPDVLDGSVRRRIEALPVVDTKDSSPWLTAPRRALSGIRKVIGASDYRAYAGCCTWLNGVYWVNVVETLSNGELLIENLYDVGKLEVKHVQAVIEPDLVYPLLRGRDVQRWRAEPSAYIVLTQDPKTRKGIPEAEMKRRWPKTYAYLKQFEGHAEKPARGTLRGRSGYRKYFKPDEDPFYSMYNVGPYTIAEWKIVWREQSSAFQAAFVGLGAQRPTLPDHKLMLVACESRLEADFLLGMLNSSPSLLAIRSYVISTSTSTHVLRNVTVPLFKDSDGDHTRLAELSRRRHGMAERKEENELTEVEAEIDEMAAQVWGITDAELKAIQEALAEK